MKHSSRHGAAGLWTLTAVLALSVTGVAVAQQPDTPPATPPVTSPATPPVTTPATPPENAPATPPPSQAPPPVSRPMAMPRPAPTPPPVKLPPNIAARVGGKDITREEVLAVFDMVGGRPVIGQMVQALVLEQEAKKRGVTVTTAEINQAVQEMKDRFVQSSMQNGGTPMKWSELASQFGIREEYVRYSAHLDVLRRKTFMKAMEGQIPSLNNQIKLAHILIATVPLGQHPAAPPTDAELIKKDTDAKAKIAQIQADITAGKTTFEEAAKQFSDDKSNAADGGALQWAPRGVFDPAFEKAAFDIKNVGEVVGPVKSQFGYHLIKLVAKGSSAPAAEKAKYRKETMDRVTAAAQNPQALQQWFDSVVRTAKVTVNPKLTLVPNAAPPSASLFPAPAKAPVKTAKPTVKKTASR